MARFDQGLRFDSGVRFDEPDAPPASPKKRMAKVKLELENKNPQEVLTASSNHIAAMASPEGVALFATPDPTVLAYKVPHDALAAGLALVATLEGQLTAARAAVPPLVADLKAAMRERATYVEATTDGDPTKIPVSGFSVASGPTTIGPLLRPEGLKAGMDAHPGAVKLSCDPVRGAVTYIWGVREHLDGTAWMSGKVGTKSREVITGLTGGKEYAFRVAAVGAAGQSPWSDEAVCRAP